MKTRTAHSDPKRLRLLVLVFLLLTLGIIAAGHFYYDRQRNDIKEVQQGNLVAFGDLKAHQIVNWRAERLADGTFFLKNHIFATQARAFLAHPTSQAKDALLTWLRPLKESHEYSNIILLDLLGQSQLALEDSLWIIGPNARGLAQEAIQTRTIQFSDLHKNSADGKIHLDMAVPLLLPRARDTVAVGTLLFRIDPSVLLYPLIQSWPSPSRTAETLLLRREGNEVVFLNELRHQKNTALTLRLPATLETSPAAMAASGVDGIVEGVDYRGVPVVAAVQRIPHSPWYLVAKQDLEEIYAPLDQQAWLAAVLVALLIAVAGVSIGSIWRGQQLQFYRTQYEAEVERRALVRHFESLTKYANDSILLIDAKGHIREANDRALSTYGYTREEFMHLRIHDIRAAETRAIVEQQMQQVESRNGMVFETAHLRKDGSTFPVEVSSRVIRIEGAKFFQSIVRDITERRQADEALRATNEKLQALIQASPLAIMTVDPAGYVRMWNKAAERVFGWSEQEILGQMNPMVPEEKVEEFTRLRERVLRGEAFTDVEVRRRTKDGTPIDLSLSTAPIRNAAGTIVSILAVMVDITERKRMEDALRTSEIKYRLLVEQASDGIIIADRGGQILLVNPKACEMLGYTEQELLRLSIRDTYPVEEFGLEEERMRVVRSGGILQFERAMRRKDGTTLPVDISLRIRNDGTFQGIVRDITERKAVTEALRKSEEQYRALFEESKDVIFISTPDGRLVDINPAGLALYGYSSKEEMMKIDIEQDLYSNPADRERYLTLMKRQGYVQDFTLEQRRRDGKKLTVLETATVIRGDRGDIAGYRGIIRDVTEWKRQQESLENLLRAVEQTDEVIFMTALDGTITYINPAFERVYGFTEEEVLGKTPRIIRSGQMSYGYYERFWKDLLAGKSLRAEHINKRKDGDIVIAQLSVNPIYGNGNSIVGFISVQADITAQKKLEEERKSLETQLYQAQKMESLGTLAGGIAHDFNNILSIIMGYASILQEGQAETDTFRQGIGAITKASRRGTNLIRQLLTFARKTDVLFESVSVNTIVEEVFHMLEATFPKTVSFFIDLGSDVPSIVADTGQLHQAFVNLGVNARDAMPNGGTLTIATSVVTGESVRVKFPEANGDRYVCLRITDTGIGMDEQTRDRIFEPFFTTKGREKGTGLGLSVVHGVVKAHHGFIDVESKVGQGTSFRLYFPVSGAMVQSPDAQQGIESESQRGSETILVVEDEELLMDLVERLLQSKGYKILAATNGIDAVKVFKKHKEGIALVLADLGLPKLNGREAVRQMRAVDPNIRIILASGYLDPQEKLEMMKEGLREFVQKPYVPAELLTRIREVLDGRR